MFHYFAGVSHYDGFEVSMRSERFEGAQAASRWIAPDVKLNAGLLRKFQIFVHPGNPQAEIENKPTPLWYKRLT